MLSRLLLSAALIVAAASCGAPPATKSETAQMAPPAAPHPVADENASYAHWSQTPERTCAFMRAEIAAGRPDAEGLLSERPYEPRLLPGFARVHLTPADPAIARRVFGRPCAGIEDVWAVATAAFDIPADEELAPFAAVRRPMMLRLPDSRHVVLAAVMPGDSHATTGFYAAFILESDQQRPYAMEGGGTFGAAGTLSAPRQQPRGAFHVWLEGGGTWQGDTQGWAAITDFSGATPQHRGRFLTYADVQCRRARDGAPCRGAMRYSLTSIDYSNDGVGELTLLWTMETHDEVSSGRRSNSETRTVRARYELRGGVYELVEGAEPPRI